jgi:hypothetical protein
VEPEIVWNKVNWTLETKTPFELLMEHKKENKMNELFEIKIGDKTSYGFKLAMNSENKLVMELKGTGEIVVVAQDAVKEIMPYTITVTSFSGDAARSYTIESGKVAVNDLVLHQPKGSKTFGLGVVTAIDTKVKGAAQFTGSRLVSELIV